MVFPPGNNWFRKFFEEQQRLQKLLNPFPKSIMQHQEMLASLRFPALEYQNSILEQASIKNYLSIAGFSNEYLTVQQQIQNSLGNIGGITKEIELLKKSSLYDSILAAQENLYRLQDQFAKTRSLFELPSTRIESVLAAAETTSRMFQPDKLFSDYTLSSVAEYQKFIDKQFKLIRHDNQIIADRRMQVTELSGGLFELINASLDIGVALEDEEGYQSEEVRSDTIIQSGLYGHVNQHLGFVYSNRYSGEVETSFNNSIPAQISCLGYAITELIFKINSICENNSQDRVFKPTSCTMRACATIPSLIARSESEFHFLVDQLFFLLYEGSGSAKRLLPILDQSLLEPLWKVKHLRLVARHDIDHGSAGDIKKKREKIKDAYVSLIAKPLPINQSDWQKAQLQIYFEIELMLQEIIQKIYNNN
ncbi:MAG: hypothetical protein KQI78_25280 [Deltaproteobacteria bacterium]|nr:hypothetical protein [Deltaproteobacteria bacterium]